MHIAEMLKLATKSERLRSARINAGYPTAAQAARRLGVPYGTYSGHENGLRGIKESELERYAKVFSVGLSWLIFGEEDEDLEKQLVNYFGVVGMQPNGKLDGVLSEDVTNLFEFPKFSDVPSMYIVVAGPYARGIAESGWRIVANRLFVPVDDSFLGELCVCHVEKNNYYLKFVQEGSRKGRYNLEGPLSETMRNVKILEVSPVSSILTKRTVDQLNRLNKETLNRAWGGIDRDITKF